VAVLQGLIERGWLRADEANFRVTDAGAEGLSAMGLDGTAWLRRCATGAHGVAYACLDWSERRDHLAGKLAAALLEHFVQQDWLRRSPGERALELTPPGERALAAWADLPQ
jgi:hypothetical protein